MNRKLSLICAVAVGIGGWSSFASYAEPTAATAAAQTTTVPGIAGTVADGQPTATLADPAAPVVVLDNAPSRDVKLTFAKIAPPPGSMVLRGARPEGSVEFGMRSDEVVAKALLNLDYTPSPSLLPVQSQLKVYLNDELMGVLPVTKEQLGKKSQRADPNRSSLYHRL
ncbi:cyclic di-GMP binding protein [Klebsiella oxytoca]|nr:cyclic di-GMP binding protein [Klebsiella oxytoca]